MLSVKRKGGDPFGILKSTSNVLQYAKDVELRNSKIEILAKLVEKKLLKGIESEYGLGLTGDFTKDVQLVFIENAVNFCFWAGMGEEKWEVEWPVGKVVSGGWYGLTSAFERALAEGVPVLDSVYLSKLSLLDVKKIFRSASKSQIPLINKRLENLTEAGNILLDKYDGNFINLLDEAKYDAIDIVKLIFDNFPSFRDVARYDGEKVLFLKRAQILANDLSYVKKNGVKIEIKNLNKLTAFADYKIPQILRHFEVIKYSKNLADRVDNYKLIKALSTQEIEIRAATVQGVELIKKLLEKYSASQIDNAIWLISQDQSKIKKPYHRTYSIYY